MDNKEKLIKIYQDTKEVSSGYKAPDSIKYTTKIEAPNMFHGKAGNILIEPMDTVSALIKYGDKKTAVLNMASSKRKGGGVEKGSMAQEECLFRCSNLFMTPDANYPIASNEFVYSRQATFFKDNNYNVITPVTADVITMPAINLNKTHIDNLITQDSVENYEELMLFKIEQILASAVVNNCDNLILGAWGCGVFKNDPKVVVELFNKVLKTVHLRYALENIVFAVINDSNSVANNYQIFLDTIKK